MPERWRCPSRTPCSPASTLDPPHEPIVQQGQVFAKKVELKGEVARRLPLHPDLKGERNEAVIIIITITTTTIPSSLLPFRLGLSSLVIEQPFQTPSTLSADCTGS